MSSFGRLIMCLVGVANNDNYRYERRQSTLSRSTASAAPNVMLLRNRHDEEER